MKTTLIKQGNYTPILILGAIILLTRTIILIANGYLKIFVVWVALLLLTEFFLDLAWMMTAVHWYLTKDNSKASLTLRLAAIAIFIHAFRVLIYVLGRIGTQTNFDIKPEYRVSHYTDWELGWVFFAAIMSVLGIIGVIVVWRMLHNAKKKIITKK